MLEIRNFINGEWVDGQTTIENINPANTDDVINHAAVGTAADVDRAVRAAQDAFAEWRNRHGALMLRAFAAKNLLWLDKETANSTTTGHWRSANSRLVGNRFN